MERGGKRVLSYKVGIYKTELTKVVKSLNDSSSYLNEKRVANLLLFCLVVKKLFFFPSPGNGKF